MEQLEPLGINLTFLITQIVNFILLVLILYAVAWKPIMRMLDRRRETIAKGLEDARVAAEARANAEKEAEGVLAKAQQQANELVQQATVRAEKLERELRTAAENDSQAQRQAALAEAEQEKLTVLGELRGQVPALAIAAAHKIIGEALDERRQHALIAELFSGVKGGKVAALEDQALPGQTAEVISALPLTEAEQGAIRKDVLGRMGSGATVAFRVDPRILGGLVIRSGGRMVDASVAGKLEGLRRSLQ
ncbi:MAG: F0F1 ATP synthase subunit B [Anaerolineales bacterium]|nr:F0F1 ATP synthase subunit B [Anaerolineales bacterium]